jgi:hypothetical protein
MPGNRWTITRLTDYLPGISAKKGGALQAASRAVSGVSWQPLLIKKSTQKKKG